MASQVLVNAKLWLAQYDLTGVVNALALKTGADMKDKTNFGSGGFRERLPGLEYFSFQHEGFADFAQNGQDDAVFNTAFAIKNTVMSIDPVGAGVEGDNAYFGQVDLSKYEPGGKVGDMAAFSIAGDSDGAALVRGFLLANRTVAASANGSPFQLGAVGAAQKIYAALHVLKPVTGGTPSLTIALQSAPASNFAAPTTRFTFNAATTDGVQWATPVAGSITDTWWRVTWTVSGTTPSFPFVAVAGIL
jgi:hypothetical protein